MSQPAFHLVPRDPERSDRAGPERPEEELVALARSSADAFAALYRLHWGPTSWLVMGSGGMTSTARDLLRWQEALRNDVFLTPEWTALYWSGSGVLSAGDMYGFEINYTERANPQFILLSNAVEGPMRRRFNRLGRDVNGLR